MAGFDRKLLLLVFVSVAALALAHCASGGYCEAEDCSIVEIEEGENAVQAQEETSVVSYFTGAVGSVVRSVYDAAKRAVDGASKIAYRVWTVLIEILHEHTKDYSPTILSVVLFIFCLFLTYLFWRWSIPLYYALIMDCGAYFFCVLFGPQLLFSWIGTAMYYFYRFLALLMSHWIYRFASAIILGTLCIWLYFVLPCARYTAREDRFDQLEQQIAGLKRMVSSVQQDQRRILNVLNALHPNSNGVQHQGSSSANIDRAQS